jgi:hypothetical protein
MTVELPPTLERLARANPARPDDALGQSPAAQAALERILADERPPELGARRRRPRRHGHRLAIVLVAALLLAVGGAVAATDPFGLFRSPNPGTAIFGVDQSRHVRPPTEQYIACPQTAGQTFTCATGLSGQRYMLTDHVPSAPTLTRKSMLAALDKEVRQGRLSAQGAMRLDADLAAVSDEFLARFNEMMHFGSYSVGFTSTGTQARVPPAGVPSLVICESAGAALRCRDMNGDDSAAVGSGIYAAQPAPNWRPAPPHRPDPGYQLEVAILGHPPTAAELRFEIDLLKYGTTSSRSSPRSPRVLRSPTRAR